MHALTRRVPFVLAFATVAAAQQPVWNKAAVLEPRSGQAMAWDSARGVAVLFGGFQTARYDETWEWDGVAWTRRLPAVRPVGRRDAAMAYDSVRQRIVLFGGNGSTGGLGDTWEWDGAGWALRTPGVGPSPRDGAQMAFDAARGVTVLYGGQGLTALADTWTWDGTAWTQLTPAVSPGPRELGAMSWDAGRQVLVLFGGTTGAANQNDTWEWNGSVWTPIATPAAPPIRQRHGLAFDAARGVTVLFGGSAGATRFNDVWEFDGATWLPIATPVPAPVARDRVALVYDAVRARTVLFGGRGPNNTTNQADTWEWDGVAWLLRAATSQPSARTAAAVVPDGGPNAGVLLFGGDSAAGKLQDTWNWDGGQWRVRAPATSPSARSGHALARDAARARTVLFGGLDASGTGLGDTWEWDGVDWSAQTPGTAPAPRSGHAMTFDVVRGRTLLFGGLFAFSAAGLDDTWEWDGATWTVRSPASAPSPRTGHALAYDVGRNRSVLFGGAAVAPAGVLGDTWEWDGSAWTQMAPANAPAARSGHTLSHDPVRGRTLLFGGVDASGVPRSDSWEWDGVTWTPAASSGPTARVASAAAYDPIRGRHVLFGGTVGVAASAETWEYAAVDAADVVPFGAGCAGSFGVPTLSSNGPPALGNAAFTLRLAALVPATLAVLAFDTARARVELGGCVLHATGTAVLIGAVADPSGAAALPLPIPAAAPLLGVRWFVQGAGIDASGGLFGQLAVSRGLDLQVGR